MFCIGLTGPIASGKSTVAKAFSTLGIDVVSADAIAKSLTAKQAPALHPIVAHFGSSVLTSSGELNRRHLRELIFQNPNERLWLEALLHPLIRKQIETEISQTKSPYCVIEIPLLTDRTTYPYLNRVLLVQADPAQQVARCMARDNASKEEVLAILASQTDMNTLIKLADDILLNTGSLAELQDKVASLHANYLYYAQRSEFK